MTIKLHLCAQIRYQESVPQALAQVLELPKQQYQFSTRKLIFMTSAKTELLVKIQSLLIRIINKSVPIKL